MKTTLGALGLGTATRRSLNRLGEDGLGWERWARKGRGDARDGSLGTTALGCPGGDAADKVIEKFNGRGPWAAYGRPSPGRSVSPGAATEMDGWGQLACPA